jgi:hypothetical protein
MHHVTQAGCQLFAYGWMTPGMMLDYTCFWGGRSSCKRSLLVEHGIFNPNFTFGCEDIELGWRLKSVGLSVVYEPAAKSTMIRRLTFHDFCNRQRRQGRAQRRFAQIHPDSEVRKYCEIDSGLDIWEEHATHSAAYLRWVESLDHVATVRSAAGLALEDSFLAVLDREYRTSFALCRAQGIASEIGKSGIVSCSQVFSAADAYRSKLASPDLSIDLKIVSGLCHQQIVGIAGQKQRHILATNVRKVGRGLSAGRDSYDIGRSDRVQSVQGAFDVIFGEAERPIITAIAGRVGILFRIEIC